MQSGYAFYMMYVIFTVQACLNSMQRGHELIKVKPNARHYRRTFVLDAALTEIRWHPSSKKPNKAKGVVY